MCRVDRREVKLLAAACPRTEATRITALEAPDRMPDHPAEKDPAVSIVLLTYNCQDFVAEAVRSALHQEHAVPVEILISDDASTDATFESARAEVARTPTRHHVQVLRQASNSGSKSAHLNHVLSLVRGEIIISFDGDDVSEPFRVARIVDEFRKSPDIQAVYSGMALIDEAGRSLGRGKVPHPRPGQPSREWFARVDAYAAGGTLAFRQRVVQAFGPLDPEVHEDIVLPFRASLLGETAFVPDILVNARRHAASLTADMDRFASLAAFRNRMELGVDRARRNLLTRLTDLAAAQALMPGRAAELDRLREILADSLATAELSRGLYSPLFHERARTLLLLAFRGAYREHLLQHMVLVFAPERYLRYKRTRFRIANASE
jgi:glycosyltransferase involved in cell wall biosynthesis